jgi:diguanylate cyclase (GGDEF)-like protein
MPETDLDSARKAAERLRKTIGESWWVINDQHVRCTVSIGLAESNAGDLSLNELMKKADEALYTAKESGRNCVRAA